MRSYKSMNANYAVSYSIKNIFVRKVQFTLTCLCLIQILSCSEKVSMERPYADLLPSSYLDSIFQYEADKIVILNTNDDTRKYEYSFVKRVNVNTNSLDILPIRSCAFALDSLVIVTSDRGFVRVINSVEERITHDFLAGRGPDEFGKPQKILHDENHIYIYDESRQYIKVFDQHFNHIAFVTATNMANANTMLPYLQPAYGVGGGYIYQINDRQHWPPVIYKQTHTGEIADHFALRDWFPDSKTAFRAYGVWASDEYVAVSPIGVPYVMILNADDWSLNRFVVINHQSYYSRIERTIDNDFPFLKTMREISFDRNRIIISVNGIRFKLDLDSPNEWGIIWTDDPIKNGYLLSQGVVDSRTNFTGADSVYVNLTTDYYAPNRLMMCPLDRDFVDFFEYRETASQ